MSGDVLTFDPARSRGDRPPPLTDAEIMQLRKMLQDFGKVCGECPIALREISTR